MGTNTWFNKCESCEFVLSCEQSRKLFGPEKPFVKLRPAYSVKLVFSYVVKGIKMKITAKFRASRRLRFEDTERIMSPEMRPKSFGTFEKLAPGTCIHGLCASFPKKRLHNIKKNWVSENRRLRTHRYSAVILHFQEPLSSSPRPVSDDWVTCGLHWLFMLEYIIDIGRQHCFIDSLKKFFSRTVFLCVRKHQNEKCTVYIVGLRAFWVRYHGWRLWIFHQTRGGL